VSGILLLEANEAGRMVDDTTEADIVTVVAPATAALPDVAHPAALLVRRAGECWIETHVSLPSRCGGVSPGRWLESFRLRNHETS
jgi:hypothetical protein